MPKNSEVSSGLPRLVFAGTPDFAAVHLKGLCEAGFAVELVLTQPDGKVGRGRKTVPTPVKACAQQFGVEVLQPESLRENTQVLERILDLQPDFMVVVAYGLMIPPAFLEAPGQGCLNVHGSILPRWRGAAPVQRAIEALDAKTGICIMQMDEGLDTGDVRHMAVVPIARENSLELLDTLAQAGIKALVEVLQSPEQYPGVPQREQGATYAKKIHKDEKVIDWSLGARQLDGKIRALQPWPKVAIESPTHSFAILEGRPLNGEFSPLAPGTIDSVCQDGLVVACGQGQERLVVDRIQVSGGKPMSIRDYINGKPEYFQKGDLLCMEQERL